jgi:D-alanyl-D-alanine carboxypeptidase
MKNIPLLSSLLWLFALHAGGQTPLEVRLDSLFDRLEKHEKAMGSVAVHRGDSLLYRRALGFAEVEQQVRAHPGTRYRIGSISKTFTATMILQLVAEGKIGLEDHLNAYFPTVPKSGEITIAHLLRHRSGLFNFTDDPAYGDWLHEPRTREQMLDLFSQHRTAFPPGTEASYSNTNYVLLSFILEKVEGKPYADILRQRIVRPLGLSDTGFGRAISVSQGDARSYHRLGGWEAAGETDASIPMGAGGLVSTPSDLNRFYRALLRGDLLPPELLAEMRRIEDGFGMGLIQFPYGNKQSFGHTGGIDGFMAISGYFPEEDLAASWTGNGLAMSMNDILLGVLAMSFDEPYVLPDFRPAMQIEAARLQALEGVYSNPAFPLRITVREDKGILTAQATGQPAFPLEARSATVFRFDAADVTLEFEPEEGGMLLLQGALRVPMNRESGIRE